MKWYQKTAEQVVKELQSSTDTGLSESDVTRRREQYGLNELKEKNKKNPIILFLEQFKSFIIYILVFALIISVISGEYVDAITILVILLFNAIFGFMQEYKAEKAIDALKKIGALKARVLRDGKEILVPTNQLVPGDIFFLEEGSRVPADARLIEAKGLQIAESSLTGESVPVTKKTEVLSGDKTITDRNNMVFSGTNVTRGRALCVVTDTGMHTEIGKIAGMISGVANEMTPLQKKLEALGKYLGIITIFICILLYVIKVTGAGAWGLLLEGDIKTFLFDTKEYMLTAIALAVAAVPEGLPAIVTIALSIGVRKMVKRNALIRRLPSVETLGETTIICSDKTGTLTKNEMTVRAVATLDASFDVTGEGYETEGEIKDLKQTKTTDLLFLTGGLCNDSRFKEGKLVGDPTEAALKISSVKAGYDDKKLASWTRLDEIPFDSVRKMMSVVCENKAEAQTLFFTKGAPEHVLHVCTHTLVAGKKVPLTDDLKKQIKKQNTEYAKKALRVLGFAYKPLSKTYAAGQIDESSEKELIFIGLQGMIDPPHKEVPEAIKRCSEAGIRVIMITGDNVETARAIARDVGILGEAMEGSVFEALSKEDRVEALKKTAVFARVEPSHKMLIVQTLQEEGEIVAMTGDGVNDAPAIKKSNLGIAMGISGTDVAKETSDMVLQDDNFTSIVNAVEEGRGIYENIRKFVNYLLSCNVGEVLIIFVAILMGWPLPMTAIMLLWLNLVTDGLPALALSVDPNPNNLMKRPPRNPKEQIMDKTMVTHITIVSILITAAVLGIFKWGTYYYTELQHLQTLAFTAIIMMELVRLYAIRKEYNLSVFSNKYLVLAVAASIGLQLLVIYTPMSVFFDTRPLLLVDWAVILSVTAIVYVLNVLLSIVADNVILHKKSKAKTKA